MPTENRNSHSPAPPCGCNVEQSASWEDGKTVHHAEIQYCPTHEAAPAMLSALKLAVEEVVHSLLASEEQGQATGIIEARLAVVRTAIAKAEGRES